MSNYLDPTFIDKKFASAPAELRRSIAKLSILTQLEAVAKTSKAKISQEVLNGLALNVLYEVMSPQEFVQALDKLGLKKEETIFLVGELTKKVFLPVQQEKNHLFDLKTSEEDTVSSDAPELTPPKKQVHTAPPPPKKPNSSSAIL